MDILRQDLRYALRVLLKNPGFTVIAVVTLAFGIGANTAIFNVVNAVLFHPLPFKAPDRLVLLWQTNPRASFPQLPFSFPNFTDVKEQSQSFEDVGAWSASADTRFNLSGELEPEQIQAARVSASFFSILGVRPILGRVFLFSEDQEGGPRCIVISHGLWQRRLGSDPNVLGKPLRLDGDSYTVIGVMPAGFAFPKFPQAADVWLALSRDPDPTQFRKYARGANFLNVIARLKPGVTLERAQTEMETIAHRLEKAYPHFNTGLGMKLVLLRLQVIGDLRHGLLVLLGAVGFVLLIACANLANLLLARATTREREIAIRIALGSSRRRIIRQLLTECVLLALLGGTAGLLIAQWGVALLAATPYHSPTPVVPYSVSPDQVSVDAGVLSFTLALSLLTGILFGVVPALLSSRSDLNQSLKEGSLRSTGGWRHHPARSLLVISEIALSLVLLIGAGLMMKSFVRLLKVDPGFKPERVLTAEISLPKSQFRKDPEVVLFLRQIFEQIRTLPGVRFVGAVSALPMSGADQGSDFFIEGQPPPPPDKENSTNYRSATPDYFRAMGIPLLQGRFFTEQDREEALRVAIINESMARRYWPGENPIGKRLALSLEALKFPAPNRPPVFDIPGAMRQIVGVVKDVRHYGLNLEPQPEMFVPEQQRAAREMSLVVLATSDPAALASAVRMAVMTVNKNQPVANLTTMTQRLSNSVSKPRFNFLLLSLFAVLALILSVVGVYGVMAYSVTERRREIGIRIALGARSGDVLRLVIGEGMQLALIGVVIGLAAALVLTRVMTSLLFGVSVTDPATFVLIVLLLAGAAMLACLIPACRAAKVDPVVALRYE